MGGNLRVNTANVTVRNSILQKGGKHGIFNSGGSPEDTFGLTVENTVIANNLGGAIVCDDESCNQTFSGLSGTGNGVNAIELRAVQNGDVIWPKLAFPYLIPDASGVAADSTMVIEAGVEVLMAKNATFDVNGSLYAVGTPQEPVIFTGTTQEPGWWGGLFVRPQGLLELRYCDVGYGGGSESDVIDIDMIMLSTNNALVSNCRLHHSATNAIRTITNVTPFIAYNRIEENVRGVVNDNSGPAPLTIDARNNWWGAASGPTHAIKSHWYGQ